MVNRIYLVEKVIYYIYNNFRHLNCFHSILTKMNLNIENKLIATLLCVGKVKTE